MSSKNKSYLVTPNYRVPGSGLGVPTICFNSLADSLLSVLKSVQLFYASLNFR